MNNTISNNIKINQCQYFGLCGGCSLRDKSYEEQIKIKQEELKELFSTMSIDGTKDLSFIPAKDVEYYRHKMEYTFGIWDDELVLGLHAKGRYYQIIDLEHCYLQSNESNEILKIVRDWANQKNIEAYHRKRRTGILRNLIVRQTVNIPGIMLVLVVTEKIEVEELLNSIKEKIPTLKSFYIAVNKGQGDTAYAEELFHIYGDKYLEESIGGYSYFTGPYSFFQNHIKQVEMLYGLVRDWAGTAENLIDLYSGVGGFGIFLSSNFKRVLGVELDVEAVELAKKNALKNAIKNCTFYDGDVAKNLDKLKNELNNTVMVVDPPRSGLHPKIIEHILSLGLKKILYVSCNPKNLVIDLDKFKSYYKVIKISAIDMFPNTKHVEVVVELVG